MSFGHLTWYTIHDAELTRQRIVDALKDAGLGELFNPAIISPADAFRRATTKAETRRLPNKNGTFTNLLVREVKSDRSEVVRHVVRETVDAQNRRLSYEQIAAIRLDRAFGALSVNTLDVLEERELGVLQDVQRPSVP